MARASLGRGMGLITVAECSAARDPSNAARELGTVFIEQV
jgi:hypothetical protein